MSDKVTMTVQVPKDLRRRAKLAAVARGETLSNIMRSALEDYVKDTEDAVASPEAIAAYERWKADPSTARPWEEFEAELKADGLLDD